MVKKIMKIHLLFSETKLTYVDVIQLRRNQFSHNKHIDELAPSFQM